MNYNTKQKTAIMQCVKNMGDRHFTVDDLSQKLTDDGATVGRTTVYRMLEKLVEDGALRKYTAALGESVCYQYILDSCHEHFHLKCEKCGRLIHLDCDEIAELHKHIKAHHGFSVNTFKTVIYGVCEDCAE